VNGRIYDLEAHLDRFLGSAERSRLALPCSRDEMRASSFRPRGEWTPRWGDSILAVVWTGKPRAEPCGRCGAGFFVMVFGGLSYPDRWYSEGLRVMTTTYPIKPPLYAVTKATNYLPNVLMQMEAKAAGSTTASSSIRAATSARART
jgi:4-amino-4-deoxychorismate lyase